MAGIEHKDVAMGHIPWGMALERRGVQQSWLIFKDRHLHVQERSIPTSWKSSKGGRRPAQVRKELLTELRCKCTRGGSRSGLEKPRPTWT